ncbi:MAG: S9 family peptidase [Actinomycetota bacterium]
MRPQDINALAWVSDPQLSPDGANVAYVLHRVDEAANRYTSQIWIAATNAATAPRALTSGDHGDSQPRWSPDGSRLAFVRVIKTDKKPKVSLRLLPFNLPGETAVLAEGSEGMDDIAWSPDGSLIALTMRVPGDHYEHDEISRRPPRKIGHLFTSLNGEGFIHDRPNHVHLVATDGACPMRDITPGTWQYSSPAWMPDGSALAVNVDRHTNHPAEDIALVSIEPAHNGGPDITLLTDGTGNYFKPLPLDDGETILVSGSDDTRTYPQNGHLGLLATTGGPSTPDWKSMGVDRTWTTMFGGMPAMLGDGTVLATIEDRGNAPLMRLDLASGDADRVVDGDLTINSWTATADGSTIAYAATTATAPAELHVVVDGESRQVTNHGHAFVARAEPREPEHFLAPSGDVEVDAWIVTPHDFDPSKKYPMLLNIHGGPFTQYGNYLFDEVQMQARAGFVAVYSNPRGGSGREDAWAHAILGPKHPVAPGSGWGGLDYDDLMAVVDTALDRYDFIDPERVGVLGGSYGGYMTTWIVSHTNRFKAACSERAANNLLSLEHSSDIGGFFWTEIGPKFYEDPDEYVRLSPTSYVQDIDTPLMIIHSEEDLRCPVDQAYQLFNALTMMEKDVEFYLFPGETHELSRSGSPIHRIQRADLIHEYFQRHLMD